MPKLITIDKSDLELHFPDPEAPLKEPQTPAPTWEQWMTETADRTRFYLTQEYSQEQRKRNPAEKRFVL
ncbi:MAG: hypothetical protein L3J39_10580 [Verrucomicrobiales bacterium]|nr:hypothetical protein [Verrucomicrobiales bacterium]